MKTAARASSEAPVLKTVKLTARRVGAYFIRLAFAKGVTSGWPDALLLFRGGRVAFVETKRTDEAARKLQAYRIKKLKEFGFVAEVVDTTEGAVAFVENQSRARG